MFWEGRSSYSCQDRPLSRVRIIQLISSDFLRAHCFTRKIFTLIFNPNVSSLNRKFLRNIWNAYVLGMWNELKLKTEGLLWCVFSSIQTWLLKIHISLPTLISYAKTMKFSVNLTWSCGRIDTRQVRELLVINNLAWWLDSCNINGE